MTPSDINYLLLQHWITAYRAEGEKALPPFGLSKADADAITAVKDITLRHWAATSIVLVQPRPGLLTALRANDNPRVFSYISKGRGPFFSPRLARLPHTANSQLLDTWCRAAGDAVACRSYGLDAADLAALSHVSETVLARWSQLPIAVAVPKPGLLPALYGDNPTRLIPFLDFPPIEKLPESAHALDQSGAVSRR